MRFNFTMIAVGLIGTLCVTKATNATAQEVEEAQAPVARGSAESTLKADSNPDYYKSPEPLPLSGRKLRISGLGTALGSYGVSFLVGAYVWIGGHKEGGLYMIPYAGPIIVGAMIARDAPEDAEVGAFMIVSLPSFAQIAGTVVYAVGYAKGKKAKTQSNEKTALSSVVPIGPKGSPGLSFSGVF